MVCVRLGVVGLSVRKTGGGGQSAGTKSGDWRSQRPDQPACSVRSGRDGRAKLTSLVDGDERGNLCRRSGRLYWMTDLGALCERVYTRMCLWAVRGGRCFGAGGGGCVRHFKCLGAAGRATNGRRRAGVYEWMTDGCARLLLPGMYCSRTLLCRLEKGLRLGRLRIAQGGKPRGLLGRDGLEGRKGRTDY